MLAVIPVFSRAAVYAAVSPHEAYDAVRDAFVAHHRGEWVMQPKVYVTNYPAGDFRAMPALGGGHALLKWVTSFPGNPARGLPTVTGLVILSNADTGQLEAVLDAAAVTALRTAAAGAIAADALARPGADDGRGDRLRRERRGDGADARGARSGAFRVGRRPGTPGAGRRAARRPRWPTRSSRRCRAIR